MAKIPFNIKFRPQIESGEYKVVTRQNVPAKIVYWDAAGSKPIVAIIAGKPLTYTNNGTRYNLFLFINCEDDLFILTNGDQEMSEFEKKLFDKYKSIVDSAELNDDEEIATWARADAISLLSIARKQFGYNSGLPTWKKYGNPVLTTFLLENSEKLFRNGYVIDLTELEKLPKEE